MNLEALKPSKMNSQSLNSPLLEKNGKLAKLQRTVVEASLIIKLITIMQCSRHFFGSQHACRKLWDFPNCFWAPETNAKNGSQNCSKVELKFEKCQENWKDHFLLKAAPNKFGHARKKSLEAI